MAKYIKEHLDKLVILIVMGVVLYFLPSLLLKITPNFMRDNLIIIAIVVFIYEAFIFFAGSKRMRPYFTALLLVILLVILVFSFIPWRPTHSQIKFYRYTVILSAIVTLISHIADIIIIPKPKDEKK